MTTFLPYQTKILNDPKNFLVIEKSRRIGVTFALAFWAAREATTNPGHNIYYQSQKYKDTLAFIKLTAKFIDILGEPYSQTQDHIKFNSGSEILAVSGDANALRSCGGSVILDEFAFTQNAEELFAAATPVTKWGGKLFIVSTHNGPSFFSQLINDIKFGKYKEIWSHHKIDIYEALNQGLVDIMPGKHRELTNHQDRVDKFVEIERLICKGSFDQEYLCKVVTEGQAIIPVEVFSNGNPKRLNISTDTHNRLDLTRNYGELFAGIDLGKRDYTVIWILEKVYNPSAPHPDIQYDYYTRFVYMFKGLNVNESIATIRPIISHPDIVTTYIDMLGPGQGVYEGLKEILPNIEGIAFNPRNKQQMATTVQRLVSQERVSLPAEDHPNYHEIVEQLINYQVIINKSGNLGYDGRTSTSHCDAFHALALACIAAEQNDRIVLL